MTEASGRIPGRRFVHSPGPTHVPDEVLDAMHRQPMDLADPRLQAVVETCEAGLKSLIGTRKGGVYLFSANGHGAWEAAIENLTGAGQTILVPATGHFSESWAQQAEALGRKVVRTTWRQGYPIDPAEVAEVLRADKEHHIKAVFIVHTDTASGVTSDLVALGAAIRASGHPALFVVDVVASLGATAFDMDALGVNAVVGASQKGLMLPPGLGILALDRQAFHAVEQNASPRFYWDVRRRHSDLLYMKYCGTAPINMLFGLQASLGLLFREGLQQVFARHQLHARAVQAAVKAWSAAGTMRLFCQVPQAACVSVSTIVVADGIDPEAIRTTARERFQVAFAGGLGPLSGKAFRIGHLGDFNSPMILGALGGVEAALQVQGIAHGPGAVQAAIDVLAADPLHLPKFGADSPTAGT